MTQEGQSAKAEPISDMISPRSIERWNLVERLAALEHEQWVAWSKTLAEKEPLSEGRLKRWAKLWVPYRDLIDKDKESDRIWARKVVDVLEASPPAAERTASADIAQAIWENDDFQDALEMIRHGIKQEQFTAYTTILQAIKSEIDASEGTKSE